jgi:hypothetical protein
MKKMENQRAKPNSHIHQKKAEALNALRFNPNSARAFTNHGMIHYLFFITVWAA